MGKWWHLAAIDDQRVVSHQMTTPRLGRHLGGHALAEARTELVVDGDHRGGRRDCSGRWGGLGGLLGGLGGLLLALGAGLGHARSARRERR